MDKNTITLDRFPEAISLILSRLDALEDKITSQALTPSLSRPVTTKQLCQFLGLTEQSIIRFRKRKIIPFYTIGSAVRYDLPKVIAALEKKKK